MSRVMPGRRWRLAALRRRRARAARQPSGGHDRDRRGGRSPALAGPAGHRLVDRERRHAGLRRRRRQRRHPLVQRVQRCRSGSRSTSAPRPRSAGSSCNWEAAYATAFTDPDLRQRHDLDDRLHHHHRHRRHPGPRPSPAPAATCGCNATARATAYGVSLWEFQVYGAIGGRRRLRHRQRRAGPARHRVLGRRAPAFPATAAVDGNTGTRWSSAFADPQWIQVDLGSSRSRSAASRCNWEAAYATAFQIQVSHRRHDLDARSTRTTTGTGGTQTLTVTGTGRYVRINGTQRAHARTATRSGSSRCAPAAADHRRRPTASPPTTAAHRARRPGGTTAAVVQQAGASPRPSRTTATATRARRPGRSTTTRPAAGRPAPPPAGSTRAGSTSTSAPPRRSARSCCSGIRRTRRRTRSRSPPNATTWTTIYSTTTGAGFKETLNVTGTGRYVRMYGTARASAVRLLALGVPGLRHRRQPDRRRRPSRPTRRSRPPAWSSSDEFNGAAGSKPDPAKWTIDPGTGQNNEVQYYTNNNNAKMDGTGVLVIEARRETAGGREYTSHRMNTGNKFHVQYGRVEARIKVPKGNGLWPAFWMMGADFLTGRPWPYNGEIDIMEVLGRNTTEGYSTLHAPAYNGGGGYGQKYTAARRRRPRQRLPRLGRRVGQQGHHVPARRPARSSTPARRPSRRPAARGSSTTRSTSSSTSPSAATSPARSTPPRRSRPGCSSTTSASTSEPTGSASAGAGPHPAPASHHPAARSSAMASRQTPDHRGLRRRLLGAYLVVAATGASAADTLLSQGRPATASSTENGGLPGRQRRRRQQRHPLVQRVQRPAVAAGRPRRHRHRSTGWCCDWEAAYARDFTDPDLGQRQHLDHHPHHHQRHRRRPDAHRHRHRPVRPDERHRARHPVGRLAVGVPGVRQPAAAPPPPTAAAGPIVRVAEFLADCPFSHRLPDDPIVFPGLPGASHMHSFFGSRVDQRATPTVNDLLNGDQQLQPVDRHVVVLGADLLRRTTLPVEPVTGIFYYLGEGVRDDVIAQTQPLPLGLRIVAGNAKATGPNDNTISRWSCLHAGEVGSVARTSSPARPARCWSPIWTSRSAGTAVTWTRPTTRATWPTRSTAPARPRHPVPVPKLRQVLRYPVNGNPAGFRLSSGARLHHARRLLQRLAGGGDGAPGARLHPPDHQVRHQRTAVT